MFSDRPVWLVEASEHTMNMGTIWYHPRFRFAMRLGHRPRHRFTTAGSLMADDCSKSMTVGRRGLPSETLDGTVGLDEWTAECCKRTLPMVGRAGRAGQ